MLEHRVWMLSLVVAIAAVSCSTSERSPEGIRTAPVVRSAISGPGADLADGFTVAPGSHLLGPVLPTADGWFAVLLVSGDPYKVLDHFRADAARAGVPESRIGCRYLVNDDFECWSYEVPFPAPVIDMRFQRQSRRPQFLTASHLLLRFFRGSDGSPVARAPEPEPTPADLRAPRFPRQWPRPLAPGDRIPEALALLGSSDKLFVEPGTRLVAPLAPFSFCSTGGFVGIFEVTGDPEEVVRGYADQFEAVGFTGSVADAASGPAATYSSNGSGELFARTIVQPGQQTYLQVFRCND